MSLLEWALPLIMPLAIDWAVEQSELGQQQGTPLTKLEHHLAARVGVQQRDKVRVMAVSQIPAPEGFILSWASRYSGFDPGKGAGLTLGHTIYVLKDLRSRPQLMAHELRHVQQFEQYGAIDAFMREYLKQIVTQGYWNSDLEQDARAYEY